MILQGTEIRKTYVQDKNKLDVLRGVNVSIDAGEVVAVVGPSGAGKSTLMHILGGLDEPSNGEVILDGENLYKLKDKQRAKVRNEKIGFVFQFYHLLPEFNAIENVMIPGFVKGDLSRKEVRKNAKSLLEQLGLEKRLKHKPYQLSGGEQQRVAIARALLNKPKIILSDEPTGNLDSKSGKEIIKLLMNLNYVSQQTIMIVTHDESIARQCHRTIHMRDGLLEKDEKKEPEKGKVYENLS